MIPSQHLKSVGPMPLERFVTTYSHDYKDVPRCEAAAAPAPALINPPQSHRETWPIFHQYFYKTTNSSYGSASCPQPPPCSLFPGCLHPLGNPAPSLFEAPAFVGSSLTEASTQEVGVVKEIGPSPGEETKGRLHYVYVGKANKLDQQEAKDEPQKKFDVVYEEGVIVLSSHDGPACCEDLLSSVCREAGLPLLLSLPVASSPIITTKEAENCDVSAYLRDLEAAIGLKNSTFQQPTSRQCSCRAWETECPHRCCSCIHRSSTLPLAHSQPTCFCREPSRSSPLTEYQARYAAELAQPTMQRGVIHDHHPPHPQTLYSSF